MGLSETNLNMYEIIENIKKLEPVLNRLREISYEDIQVHFDVTKKRAKTIGNQLVTKGLLQTTSLGKFVKGDMHAVLATMEKELHKKEEQNRVRDSKRVSDKLLGELIGLLTSTKEHLEDLDKDSSLPVIEPIKKMVSVLAKIKISRAISGKELAEKIAKRKEKYANGGRTKVQTCNDDKELCALE